jgi:GDP-L-fucose synthase
MAALIHKLHMAKVNNNRQVTLWGSGLPRRELIFVDDAAASALFFMLHYTGGEPINVGVGQDWTIRELADLVAQVVGFKGDITFDTSKPDGVLQKLLDLNRLKKLGWVAQTPLDEGITRAYKWYLNNQS